MSCQYDKQPIKKQGVQQGNMIGYLNNIDLANQSEWNRYVQIKPICLIIVHYVWCFSYNKSKCLYVKLNIFDLDFLLNVTVHWCLLCCYKCTPMIPYQSTIQYLWVYICIFDILSQMYVAPCAILYHQKSSRTDTVIPFCLHVDMRHY